jgi:hypothetical protein
VLAAAAISTPRGCTPPLCPMHPAHGGPAVR